MTPYSFEKAMGLSQVCGLYSFGQVLKLRLHSFAKHSNLIKALTLGSATKPSPWRWLIQRQRYMIPALMRKTRQEAPGLSWRVRTLFSRDPRELLASAELDLALGYFPAVEAEAISTQADQSHAADAFRSRRLYEGEYVCVMRPDHPLAGVNLDLERYCAAEHLLVSFSGRPHGFVDEALEAIGRRRRVVLTVNQFFTAGQVVLTTDLLTVLPTHFIASSGMAEKVFSTPLPLKLPSPHVDMLWHHRSEHQAVHRYVRQCFIEIAGRAAKLSPTIGKRPRQP